MEGINHWLSKASICRLARRGGIEHISGLLYKQTRSVLKSFLHNPLRDVLTYADHECDCYGCGVCPQEAVQSSLWI